MNDAERKKYIEQFAPDLEKSARVPQTSHAGMMYVLHAHKRAILIGIIIVLALAAILFAGKTYLDLRKTQQELQAVKNNPDTKIKEDSIKLVDEVGKLVVLPQGEDPTIATVTDPAKLADQPFFINAQTGDKVLIYQKSQRAILYRPAEHKVIEIAPLMLNDKTITPQ